MKRKAPKTVFKKGHKKVGGRVKGTPNKITRDVKEALLKAFTELGADKYLAKQGRRNPKSFLALLGRAIPTQLTGKDGGPIEVLEKKFLGGLANLSDKELAAFGELLKKIGITEADLPQPEDTR